MLVNTTERCWISGVIKQQRSLECWGPELELVYNPIISHITSSNYGYYMLLLPQTLVNQVKTNFVWLVVWNINFIFPYIKGISSSQLTNSYFFRGVETQPPTSCCFAGAPLVLEVLTTIRTRISCYVGCHDCGWPFAKSPQAMALLLIFFLNIPNSDMENKNNTTKEKHNYSKMIAHVYQLY